MKRWLKVVHWYYSVAMNPDVNLRDLFDGPMVELSWQRMNKNILLIRFGLLWKCYDCVGQRGLDWRPGILASFEVPL